MYGECAEKIIVTIVPKKALLGVVVGLQDNMHLPYLFIFCIPLSKSMLHFAIPSCTLSILRRREDFTFSANTRAIGISFAVMMFVRSSTIFPHCVWVRPKLWSRWAIIASKRLFQNYL